ncbi:MAG: hypothetical protein AMJ43_05730 [Coxiella sp. DG_40]|nr:MAG: hypothetical protein AMJ43_05730 [Coxiella sp. DG_40]
MPKFKVNLSTANKNLQEFENTRKGNIGPILNQLLENDNFCMQLSRGNDTFKIFGSYIDEASKNEGSTRDQNFNEKYSSEVRNVGSIRAREVAEFFVNRLVEKEVSEATAQFILLLICGQNNELGGVPYCGNDFIEPLLSRLFIDDFIYNVNADTDNDNESEREEFGIKIECLDEEIKIVCKAALRKVGFTGNSTEPEIRSIPIEFVIRVKKDLSSPIEISLEIEKDELIKKIQIPDYPDARLKMDELGSEDKIHKFLTESVSLALTQEQKRQIYQQRAEIAEIILAFQSLKLLVGLDKDAICVNELLNNSELIKKLNLTKSQVKEIAQIIGDNFEEVKRKYDSAIDGEWYKLHKIRTQEMRKLERMHRALGRILSTRPRLFGINYGKRLSKEQKKEITNLRNEVKSYCVEQKLPFLRKPFYKLGQFFRSLFGAKIDEEYVYNKHSIKQEIKNIYTRAKQLKNLLLIPEQSHNDVFVQLNNLEAEVTKLETRIGDGYLSEEDKEELLKEHRKTELSINNIKSDMRNSRFVSFDINNLRQFFKEEIVNINTTALQLRNQLLNGNMSHNDVFIRLNKLKIEVTGLKPIIEGSYLSMKDKEELQGECQKAKSRLSEIKSNMERISRSLSFDHILSKLDESKPPSSQTIDKSRQEVKSSVPSAEQLAMRAEKAVQNRSESIKELTELDRTVPVPGATLDPKSTLQVDSSGATLQPTCSF